MSSKENIEQCIKGLIHPSGIYSRHTSLAQYLKIKVRHLVNGRRKITFLYVKKTFDTIQYSFTIKLSTLEIQDNILKLKKSINNSLLNGERQNAFPLRSEAS